jgi:hypothetical protein
MVLVGVLVALTVQGDGAHEDPPAHGAGHRDDSAGARSVRACLVACGVPCRLRFFDRRPWWR